MKQVNLSLLQRTKEYGDMGVRGDGQYAEDLLPAVEYFMGGESGTDAGRTDPAGQFELFCPVVEAGYLSFPAPAADRRLRREEKAWF